MNHRMECLITLCLSAVLLFTGCAMNNEALIPNTGQESRIPTAVEEARGQVLEYVVSSSGLAAAVSGLEWQPDNRQYEGVYRFRSGDWIMVIWSADADQESQRVVIFNKVENVQWCGYVSPEGVVVDTSYMP
jgi:hypothetical protein